jgi:arabinogalactan endo-1,4-beta-galactosidase
LLVPGYAATPQGQADFVRDIRILAGSHGSWATIYWEPFWLSGSSPVENCTWADFDGFVLPSAKVR